MIGNKSILMNTGVRWAGEIFNKVLWFVFVIFLARRLGAGEFGVFNYAFSFAGLLVTFTDIGTTVLATREVSKDNSAAGFYLANVTGVKVILTIIAFICAMALPRDGGGSNTVVLLFVLALAVSAFLDPFNAIFRAHKQMYLETIAMLVWRTLLVGLSMLGILWLGFKLPGIAVAFVAASVIAVAISSLLARTNYRISFLSLKAMAPAAWPGLIASSIPLGILIVISGVFYKLNVVILQHFAGPAEVGWYGAAFKLVEGTLFVPAIFVGSLFPHLCEANTGNRISEKGFNLFKRAALFLLGIAVLAGATVSVFGKDIVRVLYGAEFLPAGDALRILAWGLVFIYMNEFFMFVYLSINRQKSVLKIMSISAVIYLLLCAIFIPDRGFIGAAWVLFWTQCALLGFNILLLRKVI